MSDKTKIAWCDSTLNFWEGCSKVSPGCINCYAETRDKHWHGGAHWGPGAPRRKSKSAVRDALRFNKQAWVHGCGVAMSEEDAKACGYMCASDAHDGHPKPLHRRRIFSLSLGDWLDPEVPIEWLAEMLDTIRRCDAVEWILCTKRPWLWRDRLCDACNEISDSDCETWRWLSKWMDDEFPSNITILASVENQAAADLRIPQLLAIPAARRGLSCEPLLGPVVLPFPADYSENTPRITKGGGIDWIICGGESGPKARPMQIEWVLSLVKQGESAGVAVFVKQFSGKKSGEQGELPDELFNIKQFPFKNQ